MASYALQSDAHAAFVHVFSKFTGHILPHRGRHGDSRRQYLERSVYAVPINVRSPIRCGRDLRLFVFVNPRLPIDLALR